MAKKENKNTAQQQQTDKRTKVNKQTEKEAGRALLGEGISFEIDGLFGRERYEIAPLKPGTIIQISVLISELEEIEEYTIQDFLAKGRNLKTIAKIIAKAIINQKISRMWKYRYLIWLLKNRVTDLEGLNTLWLIVQKQMGAQFFFLIMNATPAMNFLRKNEAEAELSGER